MKLIRIYNLFLILLIVLNLSCTDNKKENPDYSNRPADYGTFIGIIVDNETGEALQSRVYAEGSDDSLYMATKCIKYDKQRFGPRIGYTGRHFTTFDNTFTVHLPQGLADIRIERGKEYLPVNEKVQIEAGKTVSLKIKMKRWINMNEKNWYSGDTHTHRSLKDLKNLLLTEDLNVAVPQTIWNNKRESDLNKWINKSNKFGAVKVDNSHAFSVLSHEIERFEASAVFMHFTNKTEIPVNDYNKRRPTNLSLMEKAYQLNGYCEIEKPWWPESHIDVAVGKGDFVGICNNHMLYKSYLPEHPRKRSEFKSDYENGIKGYTDYVLDLYYAYLNCGFKVMPTAGSASGVLPNPLGYNRVYVQLKGEFSYEKWFKGLKAGRSFVTNGPMLIMTVDGLSTGEIVSTNNHNYNAHVEIDLYSSTEIERVEIIKDGEIVSTINPELENYSTHIETDISFSESGWIAARCFEKIKDNVRFAHSAPVFVNIQSKPFKPKKYAAQYFLSKTEELIATAQKEEFETAEDRKAVMDVYNKGKEIYSDLLDKSAKK